MPLTIPHLPTGLLAGPSLPVTDNLAAWFRRGVGFTTATGVSAWADQSGNARHLLQATGANQPPLQGDGTILLNGTSHFLKCAPFTLNQPETIYLRAKQISWTVNDVLFDGNAGNDGQLLQNNSTPIVQLFAGSLGPSNSNATLGSWVSLAAVINGASSVLQVDANTSSGAAGAANMGGFTLGAFGSGASGWANIQVAEVVIYSAAHDANQRAAMIAYLNNVGP